MLGIGAAAAAGGTILPDDDDDSRAGRPATSSRGPRPCRRRSRPSPRRSPCPRRPRPGRRRRGSSRASCHHRWRHRWRHRWPAPRRPATQPPPPPAKKAAPSAPAPSVPASNRSTAAWATDGMVPSTGGDDAGPAGPARRADQGGLEEPAFAGRVRVVAERRSRVQSGKVASFDDDDDVLPGAAWLARRPVDRADAAARRWAPPRVRSTCSCSRRTSRSSRSRPSADAAVVATATVDAAVVVTPVIDAAAPRGRRPGSSSRAPSSVADNEVRAARGARRRSTARTPERRRDARLPRDGDRAGPARSRRGHADKAEADKLQQGSQDDRRSTRAAAAQRAIKAAARRCRREPRDGRRAAPAGQARARHQALPRRREGQGAPRTGSATSRSPRRSCSRATASSTTRKATFAAIDQGDEQARDLRRHARAVPARARSRYAQNKPADAKPLVEQVLAAQPEHAGAKALAREARDHGRQDRSAAARGSEGARAAGGARHRKPTRPPPDTGGGGGDSYDRLLARANKLAETQLHARRWSCSPRRSSRSRTASRR